MSLKTNLPPLEIQAEFHIEAEASADGKPVLPRFRMVAYTGGPMRIAGWRYPVIVDLAGLAIPTQNRPIRFGHDAGNGVGHTDSIRVDTGKLIAAGVVSRDTTAAKEIVISSRNGFPWQASIGASVEEFEFVKENQKVIVNGRNFEGPVNVVRRSSLGEISFVDLGADGNTSAQIAATQIKEFEMSESLPSSGAESAPVSAAPAAPAPLSAGAAPAVPVVPTIAAVAMPISPAPVVVAGKASEHRDDSAIASIRAQALAESNRITQVRKLCNPIGSPAGRFAEIEAKAISEGWDLMKTELEVLRANRPLAPAPHAAPNIITRGDEGMVTAQMLEAACFMSGRLEGVEKHFDAQTLEAADRKFRKAIGLQELLIEAAWANGYTGRNFRDSRAVMQYAFPAIRAAYSTIDVGGILSNVANKFLLDGFFSVERVWRNICAIRNVSDFKTVTSYRLIGTDQYETVAPGGELKHGNLGNETYSNKADTYGLMLSIDRRDIINDDLGAITTVPRKLGRGSGLKINDVFWTIFLNNAAFFVVGNKNYVSGADTALTVDGLTKAEVAFMDQVDSDGKPIGVMPQIMLVPTALSAVGTQLYKSMELRDTTANTKFPVANPHQGKYRVEVSRYLGNAKYTGNSNKAWYLLSDPNDLPVIEVAFLNGQEAPTIETAEADFNVLGIQMRGYHDFGCNLQDPRGGVKSAGQ